MNKQTAIKADTVEAELAARDAETAERMRIWNALSMTDPAHTKGFSRAGGFKGTAVKPMWVIKRLTEQFGPCGTGWGIGRPQFEVVPVNDETMVYCTVSCWHGHPDNELFGVGGDKVAVKRQSGVFCDDEAFKKAFTDAVNNAFKFVGVAADIHMGLFDDSKYVAEANAEFHPKTDETPANKREKLEGPFTSPSTLKAAVKAFAQTLSGMDDLGAFNAWMETPQVVALEKQAIRDLPEWWETGEGMPAEFVPVAIRIEQRKRDLENIETTKTRENA